MACTMEPILLCMGPVEVYPVFLLQLPYTTQTLLLGPQLIEPSQSLHLPSVRQSCKFSIHFTNSP
jgi:hypothetical protein